MKSPGRESWCPEFLNVTRFLLTKAERFLQRRGEEEEEKDDNSARASVAGRSKLNLEK